MLFSPKNVEQQLNLANIAIDNALAEPSISQALDGFGYTLKRLYQGKQLREQARALYQSQKGAYGDVQTANDAYTAALKLARATYMRHLKIARIALEGERGMRQKLGLAGERKHTQAAQLAQGQQFYANALSDTIILGKLAAFGITKDMLAEGQRQFNVVAQSDAARRLRQGAAGDVTQARDAALLALDAWMRDFKQIARIALRDRPQLLDMLGMDARATRRAAHSSPGAIAPVEGSVAEIAAPLPGSRALTAESHPTPSAAAKRNGTKLAAVTE
jgi:hypothetical protein